MLLLLLLLPLQLQPLQLLPLLLLLLLLLYEFIVAFVFVRQLKYPLHKELKMYAQLDPLVEYDLKKLAIFLGATWYGANPVCYQITKNVTRMSRGGN